MNPGDEAAQTVVQMALAHGLVDDIMQEITAQTDVLDLVNRLLLADVIDASQAVIFIQLLTGDDTGGRVPA
jgi:hypothetical protein